MKRIIRILKLLIGDAIAAPYLGAVEFAIKRITVDKRIHAWVVWALCSLFEMDREGCVLKSVGMTETNVRMLLVKIPNAP